MNLTDLPAPARAVVEECIAEAWRNTESGDTEAHTEADVAADIVQRLYRIYRVHSANDGLEED